MPGWCPAHSGRGRRAPHRELWGPVSLCSPGLLPLCSGWIAALSTMKHDLAVSVIMMVVAGFFTLCAVLSLFLLKRVSGGCCASCKPKEAPAPGVGTSLLPFPWGMFITTAAAAPAASSKALGGRADRLGLVAALGPCAGGPQAGGLSSPQPLFAGALLVPQDRSQLPAGPGGVFPGHLQ